MQIQGIQEEQQPSRQLILINDKRFGASNETDRRMLLDIEPLVEKLSALYPGFEVRAVRFRDLTWTEQLRWMSRAKVFVTTQGSSAFRFVFLPPGATCVVVGSPASNNTTYFKPFHELDRWFSLSYVQFLRYGMSVDSTAEYEVQRVPGHWQPDDAVEAHDWWMYNANVRVQAERLQAMLDPVLRV
uniref:Glycosyltransferase 61 catalytic domain-containing protein n=1 Tax=Tetradesmus obliquus TaxID=3088 RepID=A0A383WL63_TETOB|eukprot:jgi/Sobl393_1/12248/SZX77486.1